MAEYVKISDPDLVRAAGQMIKDIGDTVQARAQELLSDIESIEAAQPWGSDSYGTTFLQNTYHNSWNGTPANEVLKASLAGTSSLPGVGDGIVTAVSDLQETELGNETLIGGSTVDTAGRPPRLV